MKSNVPHYDLLLLEQKSFTSKISLGYYGLKLKQLECYIWIKYSP